MIEVKMSFASPEALLQFFGGRHIPATITLPSGQAGTEAAAAIADGLAAQQSKDPVQGDGTTAPVAEETKKTRTRAKKPDDVSAAGAASSAQSSDQGDAKSTTTGEIVNTGGKTYTIEEVRKALQDLVAATDFAAGTEFVRSFGATRITEVKAEDYGRFVALAAAKASAAAAQKVAA